MQVVIQLTGATVVLQPRCVSLTIELIIKTATTQSQEMYACSEPLHYSYCFYMCSPVEKLVGIN